MLQNPTAGQAMDTAVVALPLDTALADLPNLASARYLVALYQNAGPIGLLTDLEILTAAAATPVPGATLTALRPHFLLPAVTTAETPIRAVLEGVKFLGTARWHVVMAGGGVAGVLSPAYLYQQLHAESDNSFHVMMVSAGVFGVPLAPPASCYWCTDGSGHHVDPQAANKDPLGNALCPIHNLPLVLHNPC